MIERVEATTPGGAGNRAHVANRIDTFTDRRVFRYWTLVGIINGWNQNFMSNDAGEAWEWVRQSASRTRRLAPPGAPRRSPLPRTAIAPHRIVP